MRVTSESLQAKIRQLLPSQVGFGDDLNASNTIVPIVDLTAAAEGSTIDINLQQALNYGDATPFGVNNSSQVVSSISGFFRIVGTVTLTSGSGIIELTDGATIKNVLVVPNSSGSGKISVPVDEIVWVASGITCSVKSSSTACQFSGSFRQIADTNGNLLNPSGFTPQ